MRNHTHFPRRALTLSFPSHGAGGKGRLGMVSGARLGSADKGYWREMAGAIMTFCAVHGVDKSIVAHG